MKTQIKKRIASKEESLQWINSSLTLAEREAMELPDGNPNAYRLMMNRETSEPILNKDGSLQYCAPWLLSVVFSL